MAPARLERKPPKRKVVIPTIDRVIFWLIMMVLFAGFIVVIWYCFGLNSAYYYNAPLIHGGY